MSITYRVTVDELHFQTLFARQMRGRLMFFRPPVQVPLVLVLGLAGWWFLRQLGDPTILYLLWFALAFAFLSGILAPRILQGAVLKAAKKSPEFGSNATVTLSESGVDSTGPLSQGTSDWKAFTGAVRHPDGIILSLGNVSIWLPDAALLGSSSGEATALVNEKVDLKHKG